MMATVVLATGSSVLAEDASSSLTVSASLMFDHLAAVQQKASDNQDPLDDDPTDFPDIRTDVEFGTEGSIWWSLEFGVAVSSDATDANLAWSFHYFLAQDFEVLLTAGAWYFDQDGPDAYGFNPGLAFRWHFLHRERWTMYADAGIGVVFATDEVPAGGSRVDFSPRAGVGATFQLGDSDARLDIGVRWQHFSNGSFVGSDDNPARDAIMGYVGFILPF